MNQPISLGLLREVLTNPHGHQLTKGSPAHEPGLKFVAAMLPHSQDAAFHTGLVKSLLPEDYSGNLLSEVPGMVEDGIAKGMHLRGAVSQRYEPGDVGPLPLGYMPDGRFVFYDQQRRILHTETSSRLITSGALLNMAPDSFWLLHFPRFRDGKRAGVDSLRAGDTLMNECRSRGGFDVSKIRGIGVYRDRDRVVVNYGAMPPTDSEFKYICPLPIDMQPEGGEGLHTSEVLEIFALFNWAKSSSAYLLFGWAAIAPICGALEWRPHVFLTGSRNTGKTTLVSTLANLFGPAAVVLDGGSTEAGIRQKIGADSRPVVIDEFEADQNTARMKSVIKLARSASSASGQIARGTPEGKALEFNLHSTFLFAAITPMAVTAADKSRIVVLDLERHGSDREVGERIARGAEKLRGAAPRWCGAAVEQVDNVIASIAVLRRVFPPCESRHALNISTLLAGAWCMLHRATISEEQARALIEEHAVLINQLEDAHASDDAMDCLNALLQFRIDRDLPLGTAMALLKREKLGQVQRTALTRKLAAYGVKPDGAGYLVANSHRGLTDVFRGTIWEAGGWNSSLARLPGTERTKQKRFEDTRVAAVLLPASLIPEEYDDGEQRLSDEF